MSIFIDTSGLIAVLDMDEANHAGALRKKLSLVDCVSFEVMRIMRVTTAFTLDRHFKEQGFICLPA